jgi:2-polyprenyl-3-methyl-5-hydroxy-6-metoxy-1,4-benzoquinol methylase
MIGLLLIPDPKCRREDEMRFGIIPENLIERLGLASGQIPTPLLEPYGAAFARALMVATRIGAFEALAAAARTAAEVAQDCGTDARATEKLLNLLVGMRYLRRSKDGTYRLTKAARTYLLAGGSSSVRDMVLMKYLEWEWIEGLEDFVRTGEPLDVHGAMTPDDWGLYQRGMRAQAGLLDRWLARSVPVPDGATAMLDIGGSHGHLSVLLCRAHPGLRAVVMDLPAAVAESAPLLAAEGMGDRVAHRAGDVLTDDLGAEEYDLILAFSLVHHFDAETNRSLAVRCARALRPGGVYVIGDLMRAESPSGTSAFDIFYDLYFALTSRSGLWSSDEMASWQREAGLSPRKPKHLFMGQGPGLQIADRPEGRESAPVADR